MNNDVLTDDEKNAAGVIVGEGKATPKANPHYDARLRDEFAMAALSGLIANPEGYNLDKITTSNLAYEYADVMMEARNK